MSRSQGYVLGLRQHLNSFMAEEGLNRFFGVYSMGTPNPTLSVVITRDLDPSVNEDGDIAYTLLERRGGVATWRLDQASVYSLYPTTVAGQLGWGNAFHTWAPGEEDLFVGEDCEGVPSEFWLPYVSGLVFMTISLPWQMNHARTSVIDYVVAVATSPSNPSAADAWDVLLPVWFPEQGAWVVDCPTDVNPSWGEPLGANDPIYRQGADR